MMHGAQPSRTHEDQLAAENSRKPDDFFGRIARCLVQPMPEARDVNQRARIARGALHLLAVQLLRQVRGGKQAIQPVRRGPDVHQIDHETAEPVLPGKEQTYRTRGMFKVPVTPYSRPTPIRKKRDAVRLITM